MRSRKKHTGLIILLVILCCVFSGLSVASLPLSIFRGNATPAPESTPLPTPVPTPEPTLPPVSILGTLYPSDTVSLTLQNVSSSDVSAIASALKQLVALHSVTISQDESVPLLTSDDYLKLARAVPDADIECEFDLFGQRLNTRTTTRLDYLQTPIGDDGLKTFRNLLPYLRHLSYLSFDRCDTTDRACASLRDDFPDTEIVWRVFFSPFSCMTDIETIWASVDLRDETCEALKYCTKVKHLDIGHSAMTDLSFLDYMPDLEVLIIACSDFEDISCLHSLVECKNLKRFYAPNMRNMQLDMEKEEAIFRSLLPGVEMDFSKTYMGLGSLNGRWRYTDGFNGGTFTEPYRRIREIFRYDDGITAQPRLLF